MTSRYYSNKIIIISLFFIGLFLFLPGVTHSQEDESPDVPELYLLDTCPHCQELLKKISETDFGDLRFREYEVSNDANLSRMQDRLDTCESETSAVPMMYYDQQCFFGTTGVYSSMRILAGLDDGSISSMTGISEGDVSTTTPTNAFKVSDGRVTLESLINGDSTSTRDTLLAILIPASFVSLGWLLIRKIETKG